MNWTKAYYGVQHLRDTPRTHQITLTNYGPGVVVVYMLHLAGPRPFTPTAERVCDSVAEAQAWAESHAAHLT